MTGRSRTSHRRRTLVTAAALVAVLAAGAGTWALVGTSDRSSAAEERPADRSTAPVTKGDLVDSKTFSGSLGYGASKPLVGAAQGTLTWLPEPGATIGRDQPLYAVDEQPVRSMHGTVPLWRALERGDEGQDVTQLNQNLAALGYDVAQDDTFGPRTQRAVREWQEDRGLEVTGRIDAQQVAFVDGDVRVDSVAGQLGQPANGPVLQVTSTQRVVTVTVPSRDAERLAVGTDVSVRINGAGDALPGRVVDAAPGESKDGSQVVDATISFDAGDRTVPESGSAQVIAAGRTEQGVLSVPVSALAAGSGSGFAVDVVRGDTTERVPVEVGFVAEGRAAITGDVREGDRVVVPS